jgi:hypothetical protein
MWGRSRSTVSAYIAAWAPKWGQAGKWLSILDIDEDFLVATEPQSYIDDGLRKIGYVVDGKDFATDTPRTHTAITRAFYSDKVRASLPAGCFITANAPLYHRSVTVPSV